MTIKIVLRDEQVDKVLSLKDSRNYIKGMWLFNHGECCGLVDEEQMEDFTIQMMPEYDKDSVYIDDVEYIDCFSFGGIKLK